MDAAERALLYETVVTALTGAADADMVLTELGWRDLLAAEPADAIGVVGEALGATNQSASVLDDALGAPLDACAVLLPAFGAWDPPGEIVNGRVQATGLATRRAASARDLIVATEHGRCTVPLAAAELRPVLGIDPPAGLYAVNVDVAETEIEVADWAIAVAHARRLIASETLGATRAMLDLARVHALARVQFERPISSFQAVRHRLADALVAIEALAATLDAAAVEPNTTTALLAKATAGRTARTVATNCQQVLAGIGFTTEHPFHRYLKRTMLLDGLFGRADDLAVVAGRELLTMRRVPTLIEL